MMKKAIFAGVASAAFGLVGSLAGPTASADPPPWSDPHYPDRSHGSCAGGYGGGFGFSYCDGEHYPDGSYWHQVFGAGMDMARPQCVVMNGGISPEPAPPGGCNGAG